MGAKTITQYLFGLSISSISAVFRKVILLSR